MICLELIWERGPFEFCTVKVTGFSVCESDGLPFVEIDNVEGLVSEVLHWTRKPIYIATRETRRRRKVLLRQKNGCHKAIERKSTARYEIQNYEMPLESQAASKVFKNNSSRINSDTCSRLIKLRKTNSGLCYCDSCKVTRWHVCNFLCSDWRLCTVEFKITE